MKLEEGKYYRTKSGRKVKCIAVSVMDHDAAYGALCDLNDGDYFAPYTVDGRYHPKLTDDEWDIVAEWKEPKKYSAQAYLWSDGKLTGDYEKPLVPGCVESPYVVESRTIEWEVESST